LPALCDGVAKVDVTVAGPAAAAFCVADFFGFLISLLDLCWPLGISVSVAWFSSQTGEVVRSSSLSRAMRSKASAMVLIR
jgi:hypothetical protein